MSLADPLSPGFYFGSGGIIYRLLHIGLASALPEVTVTLPELFFRALDFCIVI